MASERSVKSGSVTFRICWNFKIIWSMSIQRFLSQFVWRSKFITIFVVKIDKMGNFYQTEETNPPFYSPQRLNSPIFQIWHEIWLIPTIAEEKPQETLFVHIYLHRIHNFKISTKLEANTAHHRIVRLTFSQLLDLTYKVVAERDMFLFREGNCHCNNKIEC